MAGGVSRAGSGGFEPQARPQARGREIFGFAAGPPPAAAPPSSGVASSSARPRGEPAAADDLSLAQARITELERVIGRQQADLHFFREALRLWDATSPNDGAPISTKSSKK
jgi:hypothetical protein